MLFQGYDEYLTVYVLLAIIMFILGILLTSWRAKKFDYDTSIKPNLILNAFWALIIILLFFILSWNPTFYANLVFKFLVDLFIGALIVSLVYHESYSEALRFLIVLVIILLVLYIVIAVILVIIIIL